MSNWRWIRLDQSWSSRRVRLRRAEHSRDRQRRVGLSDRGDELAAAAVTERAPQPPEERAHRRTPAIGGARRERPADQGPQPPVTLALLIEDVGVNLLAQPPGRHAEQVGDLPARKRGRSRSQEELGRLAIEHDVGQRRRGEPAELTRAEQAREPLVMDIARQIAAREVDARQVKLGHNGHGDTVSRGCLRAQAGFAAACRVS